MWDSEWLDYIMAIVYKLWFNVSRLWYEIHLQSFASLTINWCHITADCTLPFPSKTNPLRTSVFVSAVAKWACGIEKTENLYKFSVCTNHICIGMAAPGQVLLSHLAGQTLWETHPMPLIQRWWWGMSADTHSLPLHWQAGWEGTI